MLQKAIEKAQVEIARFQATIEYAKLLPESDLPIKIVLTSTVIHVDLPFDWDIYREYRHLLGREWQTDNSEWCTTQHKDNTIHRHMSFRRKGQKEVYPSLMVALDSDSDKSVCQVKQVGAKKVPIMEVVCS